MQSQEKQPVSLFLNLFFKIILGFLVILFSMIFFDPFFVAYKAKNIEWAILVILMFLIFTQVKVRQDPELNAKRRMELQIPSSDKSLSLSQILGSLILIIGLIFFFNKRDQVDIANHIPEFQSMATPMMQQECAKNCAAYGVTQNLLIGPKTEESYCCISKSGRINFLFSWHSNTPDVTLKIKIHKQNNRYPLTIEPYWIGNKTLKTVTSNASSAESHQRPPQEQDQPIRNDMNSVIKQNQSIFESAYHHALKGSPSMHGSYIEFYLRIAPNGQVTNSNILSTDINSNELKAQLLKIFSNLHFSSGNFQTIDFTYRLHLQPIQPQ